jgi:hypothetical protein
MTRPFLFASSKYGGMRPMTWMTDAEMAMSIMGHSTPLLYGPRRVRMRISSMIPKLAARAIVARVAVQTRHLLW